MTAMRRIEADGEPSESKPDDADRYGVDPKTGFEYVKRRPEERMVTSEEILKELEDFP